MKKKRVFLGGTCNNSTWRDELIPLLTIDYFNPVVDNWNDAAYNNELQERLRADTLLYCFTPNMTGVYAIAEVVDDSNKRPEKTIMCILSTYDGKSFDIKDIKSLVAVAKMVRANGGMIFNNLDQLARYLNKE